MNLRWRKRRHLFGICIVVYGLGRTQAFSVVTQDTRAGLVGQN
jgi:hypothetical protein